MVKEILTRNSVDFREKLRQTSIRKLQNGTAKELIGCGRLTDAIAKQPEFDIILKRIETFPTKPSKRGRRPKLIK